MSFYTKDWIQNIFTDVCSKYDVMNDVMSIGMHRLWKKKFCSMIDVSSCPKIIDVACGSGDIAISLMKAAVKFHSPYDVTMVDLNPSMLELAKSRAINMGFICEAKVADAEALDFAQSDSYDFYTMAFGIRNIQNKQKALSEAKRVLKTGGQMLCMEFSRPGLPIVKDLYKQYTKIIPILGKYIAGNAEAYQYLIESIELFPTQSAFTKMIKDAGFRYVEFDNLSGSIATIYRAFT